MFFTKKSPFNIENYYTQKIKSSQIGIYVNNYCNANCNYCAIKQQKGKEKIEKSMSKEIFLNILSKIEEDEKIKEVEILGKEPSLWEHLDFAIEELHKIGKRVLYLTNGINKRKVYPDTFMLHIDKEFINKKDIDISYFINFCKNNSISLNFVVVITEKSDIKYYYNYLKQADSFDINLACPININKNGIKVVNLAIDLFKKLYNKGYKNGIIDMPIPYCLLNKGNFNFLDINNIKFPGTCRVPNSPIIDVDGKSIYPCIMLPKKIEIGDTDISNLWKKFYSYVDILRNKMPLKKCYKCSYYIDKKCQGGCLINRYKNNIYG